MTNLFKSITILLIVLKTLLFENSESSPISFSGRTSCREREDLSGVIGDCSKFLRCIYGHFYTLSCPTRTYFDYQKKLCVPSSQATCLMEQTTTVHPDSTRANCKISDDLSGVQGDCTKFLRCVYGKFYPLNCPIGTNFDYVRKLCVQIADAICYGVQVPTSTIAATTIQRTSCISSEDLSGIVGDCSKFLRCVYGHFYPLSCPNGMNFDYIRKLCDTIDNAVCFGFITSTNKITHTSTRTPCSSTDDLSGVIEDCSKFLRCVYGHFYQLSCPPETTFDYIQKLCVPVSQSKCLGSSSSTSTTIVATTTTTTSIPTARSTLTTSTTITSTTTTSTTTTKTTYTTILSTTTTTKATPTTTIIPTTTTTTMATTTITTISTTTTIPKTTTTTMPTTTTTTITTTTTTKITTTIPTTTTITTIPTTTTTIPTTTTITTIPTTTTTTTISTTTTTTTIPTTTTTTTIPTTTTTTIPTTTTTTIPTTTTTTISTITTTTIPKTTTTTTIPTTTIIPTTITTIIPTTITTIIPTTTTTTTISATTTTATSTAITSITVPTTTISTTTTTTTISAITTTATSTAITSITVPITSTILYTSTATTIATIGTIITTSVTSSITVSTTTSTTTPQTLQCENGFIYNPVLSICPCSGGFSGTLCESFDCSITPIPDLAVGGLCNFPCSEISGFCPIKCVCGGSTTAN